MEHSCGHCWTRKPGEKVRVPVHPKVVKWGGGEDSVSSTPNFGKLCLHESYCAQGQCHAGTSLSLLVPVKKNS